MAILGGSPLGLIGTRSLPTSDGMTTFNGGASRKISVNSYNNASGGENGTRSLFSGSPSASVAPYGNIGKIGTETGGGMDMSGPYKGIKRSTLHNNTVYDTSLLNIIEQLSGTQAELRPSDFAYLKDVGVYPNNRLMIARRFLSPHADNIYLTGKGTGQPSAIMISWKPQGEDFLKISFGEKWEEAEADFKSVLDSLGEDFLGKQLGQRIGGAVAVVPLPGFTETIQRTVLRKLGVLDDNDDAPLPSGNPNLIKMAKRRQTVKSEQAGSGLNCSVSIQMVCEWEQKFISGIDPTIAWQDILGKILTFATSRSNTYGLTPKFEVRIKDWMDNPEHIVKDMVKFIKEGLDKAKKEITNLVNGILAPFDTRDKKTEIDKTNKYGDLKRELTKVYYRDKDGNIIKDANGNEVEGISFYYAKSATEAVLWELKQGLSKQLNKYRIAIEGIARSLSGAPSTPWHITLGNPLRPVFCAGDMYMDSDLVVDLGPTLSFNDLPSNIKATFTLTNARPWGLQEIAAKFNAGSIRVVTIVKDANDLNHGEVLKDQIYVTPNTGVSDNNISTQGNSTLSTNNNNGLRPQVSPIVPLVASGTTLTPFPTQANNFNKNSSGISSLTAGVSNNIDSSRNQLDNFQNSVNNGLSQAQSLAARAQAAADAAKSNISNGVETLGANYNYNLASATGTLKESTNLQSIVPDANSSIGTTLQNVDFLFFGGI